MHEKLGAFIDIFNIQPSQLHLMGVKRRGYVKNDTGDTIYEFESLIEAPTDHEDLFVDENFMHKLRNRINYNRKLFRETTCVMDFHIRDDDDKKLATFTYVVVLNPKTILDFRVKDGKYIIRCLINGILE